MKTSTTKERATKLKPIQLQRTQTARKKAEKTTENSPSTTTKKTPTYKQQKSAMQIIV